MRRGRPDPVAHLTGALSGEPHPESITLEGGGGKFTPDGRVLPFPGLTVICHLDPASDAFAALVEMREALMAAPLADRFTFLPPESFHMTVFAGFSGPRAPGRVWPKGLSPDASQDAAVADVLGRLEGVSVPQVRRVRPAGLFGGYSLTVTGADAIEEAALRATRQTLRDATGLRSDDFDDYAFHITLGYQLAWLSADEARATVELSAALFNRFVARVPSIALGRCEVCVFDDMHRFTPLRLL